jgi:hypothetical protein
MYFSANTLQNIALSILEHVSRELHLQVVSYVDPNTMHHMFTFLAPLLAFFAAAAGVIFSVVFFLRHHLVCLYRKTTGMKLVILCLVFVSIVTCAIIVLYKLIL